LMGRVLTVVTPLQPSVAISLPAVLARIGGPYSLIGRSQKTESRFGRYVTQRTDAGAKPT
jgi:hypothetical protein